jgi:aminoglycoside 3-N-acetyltransferase
MSIFKQLANKPVCIHASMRSFGTSRTSPDSIANQLLEIGCTIVVPTFTYGFELPPPLDDRPPQNGWDYDRKQPDEHDRVYNHAQNELSYDDMGAFPACILNRAERIRGNHPLNSFSAIGPLAERIISTQTPDNVYGPLKQICDLGGGILLIGVGYTSMTLLHLAEADAGRNLFRRWARDDNGLIISCSCGGCSNGFDRFEEVLSVTQEYVRESRWRLVDAAEARALAATAVHAAQDFARCSAKNCLRCADGILGGPVLG